jgi:hypothetical protein
MLSGYCPNAPFLKFGGNSSFSDLQNTLEENKNPT